MKKSFMVCSFFLDKAYEEVEKLTKRLTPSICNNYGLFLMTEQLIVVPHYSRYNIVVKKPNLNIFPSSGLKVRRNFERFCDNPSFNSPLKKEEIVE